MKDKVVPNYDPETKTHYGVTDMHALVNAGVPFEDVIALFDRIGVEGESLDEVEKDENGEDMYVDSVIEYIDQRYLIYLYPDMSVLVAKSPYFTMAGMASPVAPNAGYLTQEGSVTTYAIGPELLDKVPYTLYHVSDGGVALRRNARPAY
jgi:hypothetical protein